MPVIGLRQLSRETANVVEDLLHSDEPVVITKHGTPIATLSAVDESEVRDLVLGLSPEIKESSTTAEVELSSPGTRSLDEVSDELAEEAFRSAEGREALVQHGVDLEGRRLEASAELDRLYAEGLSQLSEARPEIVFAWSRSTQMLIRGAVDAALASAQAFQADDAEAAKRSSGGVRVVTREPST